MNLTQKMVECLRDGTSASLPIEMPMSKDICEDNLAMWKMLEDVRWDRLLCCIECGAPRGHGCGPDCKINELMG